MTISRVTLVAYEDQNPARVFVAVSNERGRYVRADRCVIEVSCPARGSMIGEPCRGDGKLLRYWAGTHTDRWSAASQVFGRRRPTRGRIIWLEEGHFT